MTGKLFKSGIRASLIVLAATLFLLNAFPTNAGQMFLEYQGELSEGYTFFRGSFDLADLDRDGAEDMIIADDNGGYHVYRYTPGGFVPMWISDPILDDGYIVSIEIIEHDVIGFMPHILLLDSNGTLHQIVYTGYLFEETATYPDYRIPGESGRLVITGIGNSGTRNVIIALPNDESVVDETGENSDEESEYERWEGMTLYYLTSDGLRELTEDEIAGLDEGEVYFVQDLSESEITGLQSLQSLAAGRLFPADSNMSGRAGIADMDRDALLELLVAFSDPDLPIDRLEIWQEEEGEFTVRVQYELPLLNEMMLGDIDADGFSEIVGLTFDGTVLVYQYDPLTVMLADGTEIEWEIPHRKIDGTIWMSLGGFEALGCSAIEEPDQLEVIHDQFSVMLDRTGRDVICGDEVILPDVPDELLESVPFLPFFSTLECLGFIYTYDPERNLVEVGPSE